MKSVIKIFSILILLLQFWIISAQDTVTMSYFPPGFEKVVILQPTGVMINELPEMTILSDTTQLYNKVSDIIANSYINNAIHWYFLAQVYLKNRNEKALIEPAYLALSQNDGGFARVGFFIKQGDSQIDKSNTPYIDIVKNRFEGTPGRLMSITQLYPHEMGHLIYGMLKSDTIKYTSRSVDMHYFSVKTNYSTAFNEGFAEHIENVSRLFEKSDTIRNGILADIEKVKVKTEYAIKGFENDFIYPLRLGYFKTTMPVWYQKYENLKRYQQAIDGSIKYLSTTLDLSNLEDQITIRNAGIYQNQNELRNYVQLLTTEGLISAFFTKLIQSDLPNHYLDKTFYKAFLIDTTKIIGSPEDIFSPVQNQFLKYFVVFHSFMNNGIPTNSEFINFMEGYIKAFPSEEEEIKRLFREVTDTEYTNELPAEIWLSVMDYQHRLLVLDPYGAITIPLYTFDLNAAEVEDLLTIEGVTQNEANKIIEYRKTNGFFTDLNQLKDIAGVSDESVNLILNCEFDQSELDNISMPELSFTSLILVLLQHLLCRALAYFVLIFGLIYIFFLRKENLTFKKILLLGLKNLLLWILFVFVGLILVVLINNPWQFLIMLGIFVTFATGIIYKKNKVIRNRSIFTTLIMFLLILLSII